MTPAEKYFQRANGGKPSEDSEMITAKWATILMTDFAEQENKELRETAIKEFKIIAQRLARVCTPSEFIDGIDERFDKWWELNKPELNKHLKE